MDVGTELGSGRTLADWYCDCTNSVQSGCQKFLVPLAAKSLAGEQIYLFLILPLEFGWVGVFRFIQTCIFIDIII